MSLFKTKEWWRTKCGTEDESFAKQSLLVGPLFGCEKKDFIVAASHKGYLRIYNPSSQWDGELKSSTGFKPVDLILETHLTECIIDMKVGRFVSGSQDLRLAILTPNKLIVYTVYLNEGSVEHVRVSDFDGELGMTFERDTILGNQGELKIAYEHELPRFPITLTVGPFGGVHGRDFLCVQCLDGSLIFYEQETHVFDKVLQNRLLPGPIVYISRNDVFVMASSTWSLDFYRYQSLAESSNKIIEPDSTYNIGEYVFDIDLVILSSFEIGIVILGERNLYCLKDNYSTLKYAKRFDYRPLCFQAYVIEPDGKLMILIITDTKTLMIYEGTTLRWSAQLPFAPVAVARAHFQNLEGALVLLSDEGDLEVCYLGSEPSLFIAPPLNRRTFDPVAAENQLSELRKFTKKTKISGDDISNATTELVLTIDIPNDLEAHDEGSFASKITIELSSYTTLFNVQICINVSEPLQIGENVHTITNLCDRHIIRTSVLLGEESDRCPGSSEVKVTGSYETDRGSLKIIQKTAHLPLKLLLRACPPENTSTFTAILKCDENLIGLGQLFPEFTNEHQEKQSYNALGLQHLRTGKVVSIVCGSNSNRYRVQSSDGLSMTLVVQQLINRLRDKSNAKLVTCMPQNYELWIQSLIDEHFSTRLKIDRFTEELVLLTTQLRNIERRMLRVMRERNARSLTGSGLILLLESTHDAIYDILDQLTIAHMERDRASHNLQTGLKLLLLLLRENINDDKYALLESAIGFESQLRDQVDWEEIADIALAVLSKSTSITKRSGNSDSKALSLRKFTSNKDLVKLKKRLIHVVERLDSTKNTRDGIVEQDNSTSLQLDRSND